MSNFDHEIERQLDRVLRPFERSAIPAWRAPVSPTAMKRVLGGAGAALGAKLVTGFAVVAMAAGAGVATEAAVTRSLNPADWGQQVKQQVSSCKAALSAGEHGIGECVSTFASRHGAAKSGQKEAKGAGGSNGHGKSNSNNNHQDHGQQGPGNNSRERPPWVRD
jgi:hypothetical protein